MGSKTATSPLADLGLARPLKDDSSLTQAGSRLGTPDYISPEQAMGESGIDGRSDFYSLGATGYHMLTGMPPFEGETGPDVMAKHVREEPLSPGDLRPDLDISKAACELINVLMEKIQEAKSKSDEAQEKRTQQIISDILKTKGW